MHTTTKPARQRRPLAVLRSGTCLTIVVVTAFSLAIWGCRSSTDTHRLSSPVFDGSQTPLVLTESGLVSPPASLEPNRFIRGWWPLRKERLAAIDGARLQLVKLADVRRQLVLEARVAAPDDARTVQIRVGGGKWKPIPLARRMRIPIPARLAPGRVTVDFRLPQGAVLAIERASLKTAAPAGDVAVDGDALVQSGFSLVEIVKRIEPGSSLRGVFQPPSDPRPGQRFAILARSDSGAETEIFRWQAEEERASRSRDLTVPLEGELVTLRFLALGLGPPATWTGMRIEGPAPPSPATIEPPTLPRIVVVYVMDALRADFVGHLGGPNDISPTIDRLAAEGATFEKHFAVAPNTVPSMKSMFSGNVYLLDGHTKLATDVTTLATRFYDAGYRTGLFSGNGNVSSWRGLTRGFEHVAGGVLFGAASRRNSGYNNNAEVLHAAALDWLSTLERSDRAFLHIQTIHPHNPYDPPEPYRSRFVPQNGSTIDGTTRTLKAIRNGTLKVSAEDRARLEGLYAASVAYNDAHLDSFLATLLEEHPSEEILLLLTSDHGEELFEHGGVLHGYTLYDEMLRIPLVAWWPGTIAPRRISGLTDTLDLYKTLSLATTEERGASAGRSLWPLLLGNAEHRDWWPKEIVFASASSLDGGIFMARSERAKALWAPRTERQWGQGASAGRTRDGEYAFDLVNDPGETVNIAGEPIPEIDRLRSHLMAWIETGKKLEAGAAVDEMDESTRESLRALGYLD